MYSYLIGALLCAFLIIAKPVHASFVINEILADPSSDSFLGDSNGDGVRDSSEDEFLELVNASASSLDISGWYIMDGVTTRHTFAANTFLESGMAIIVFGGGAPTGSFGGSMVTVASTGMLGLNNGGDNVAVYDALDMLVESVSYGAEGGNNQSLTRAPDLTGSFVQHATVSDSLFSPGSRIDNAVFVEQNNDQTAPVTLSEPTVIWLMLAGLVALMRVHRLNAELSNTKTATL